jgi:inhibitor of KinA
MKEEVINISPADGFNARFRIAGDRGLLVEYGDRIDPEINARVRTMDMVLAAFPIDGIQEVVPTYRSLLVIYDPLVTTPAKLAHDIEERELHTGKMVLPSPRTVEIPVCYGGDFGPDIEHVANFHGLEVEDVVAIHTRIPYRVYMIGFTPGYPFMGGLPESLHTPRLETPRTLVPEGSVGIANDQTGIYPVASPGGWQLIGRTPLKLFSPDKENPFLFKTGDNLKFVPVSVDAFERLRKEQEGR